MRVLHDIRTKKKITLADMAKDIGVSLTAYHAYENGDRKIPADKVDKICRKLRINKGKFFLPATFTVREHADENKTG